MASLAEELNHIKGIYATDVQMLRDFVDATLGGLQREQDRWPLLEILNLKKEEFDEFGEAIQKLLQFTEECKTAQAAWIADKSQAADISIGLELSDTVAQLFHSLIKMKLVPQKHAHFLSEMALAYLISFQEAFIKDYLKALLVGRPLMLKSRKQVTMEEICSFTTMDRLLDHLADKDTDQLLRENIDEVARYFEDRLNIKIAQDFSDWSLLREASYRRNLVLHNRAITNELYCSRAGYPQEGKRLETDAAYVLKTAKVVLDFMDFIHAQVRVL